MAQSPNATAEAMAAAMEAMLRGPGLEPPPGVIPNFIDPPSQAYWVYVTLPICLAVSTPFVWIRLYSAFFILKSHGWADCVYIPVRDLHYFKADHIEQTPLRPHGPFSSDMSPQPTSSFNSAAECTNGMYHYTVSLNLPR